MSNLKLTEDLKNGAYEYFKVIGVPEDIWERLFAQLAKQEKTVDPVMTDHVFFEDTNFCYNNKIDGKDDESKFQQFVDIYRQEKKIEDIEHAKQMASSLILNIKEKKAAPVSVVTLLFNKKVYKTLVAIGARHRVAAAKVSNSKIPTKILTARV